METKETDPATRSFDDSLACVRCYAKHLAKALVLWGEWREDDSRDAELALCIGNIGCAEDHAAALRREADRKQLHDLRERIYENPATVESALQRLAAAAARSAATAELVQRARRATARASVERPRAAVGEGVAESASSGPEQPTQPTENQK